MSQLTTTPPQFNVQQLFGTIVGPAQTTVRLHPRLPQCELSFKTSKVGGPFLWPAREPWPCCPQHETDYAPILQLRTQDFPELSSPPGADTLQILWCPNDHAEVGSWPAITVYWHDSASPDVRAIRPAHFEVCQKEYIANECELNPERVPEFPSAFTLREEDFERMAEISEEAADIYQSCLSVAPGLKLGGYPNWSQDPAPPICECGKLMRYVLTVDSSEFDGGTFARWVPVQERQFWSASYDQRTQVQAAAGLTLGDMGEMNLFVCMDCSPWNYRGVFQCS
jgi:hypothetical protein